MNFTEYQDVLDAKWAQLETKIKLDEDFKKSGEGKIQVTEEFYITLNTSNLPGLKIFCEKNFKINEKNLPICKGWKLNLFENTITNMNTSIIWFSLQKPSILSTTHFRY